MMDSVTLQKLVDNAIDKIGRIKKSISKMTSDPKEKVDYYFNVVFVIMLVSMSSIEDDKTRNSIIDKMYLDTKFLSDKLCKIFGCELDDQLINERIKEVWRRVVK